MLRFLTALLCAVLVASCGGETEQEPRPVPGAAAREAAERAGAAVAEREREVDSLLRADTARSHR